jgi:hypothetical protein
MTHHVYMGAAEHHLAGNRVRRFEPTGPLTIIDGRRRGTATLREDLGKGRSFRPGTKTRVVYGRPKTTRNPVERYGGGGLAARVFVGLNVGRERAWTEDEVVEAVRTIREAQGAPPDASFLTQLGIYSEPGVGIVEEPSMQIVFIDTQGVDKDTWERQMKEVGVELRKRFLQKEVIVELQEKGVVTDVFGVKA